MKRRHLWPALFTSGLLEGQWKSDEIVNQVRITRGQRGAGGSIHYSAQALMKNSDQISPKLKNSLYKGPALVPSTPWLDSKPPAKPSVTIQSKGDSLTVNWKPRGQEPVWLWVLQGSINGKWHTRILPGSTRSFRYSSRSGTINVGQVAVSAVDRCGNQSNATILVVP